MEYHLFLSYCGVGTPSSEKWHLSKAIEFQRLYYILGGSGGYTNSDGSTCAFQKGHIYLFPYNLRDCFYSDVADPVQHLFFDFLSTPPIISPAPIEVCVDRNDELQEALKLTCRIFRSRPRANLLESPLSKHLLQLLLTLINEIKPVDYHMDPVICRSLERIQRDYCEPLTVTTLAQEAGFEENYYIRRFRSVMQQTPYSYLRNFRLMQARRFLQSGLSMSDAAANVGYGSAASLSRALRKSSG